MLSLAVIVAAFFMYKIYKLKIKHDSELQRLREDNADLRVQLEKLRREYEQMMQQRGTVSSSQISERGLTDTDKLAQLAEAIRRKEPLL